MVEVYDYCHTVGPQEVDALGHANNVAYVVWMQDAALAHSAAQGWPREKYRQSGYGWVVRSHKIDYLQPAFLGDQVVVRTWVATMHKATSLRRYHILRQADSTLLAKAETMWAFVSYATLRPARIPREIAVSFPVVEK